MATTPQTTVGEITVQEVTEDATALVDDLAVVRVETDRDVNPDDPPMAAAELAAELFATPADIVRRAWVACVDGEPAGEATIVIELDEENRHIVQGEWLAVRPSFRRRGVADALLRVVLDEAAASGRTSLMLWVPVLDPDVGAVYTQRLGLTERMAERCSRLDVGDHDAALVQRWLEEGRSRTDGYRVAQWVGRCPDEHLDALVQAHRAMEDMPIDDMEWTIPTMTAEKARSGEAAWERGGQTGVTTLALAPDGDAAGLSELQVNRHRPQLAAQGDTGVVEAHRGHGLGRWLKAENFRLALEVEPRVRTVETYNAQTNPWMLGINVAMGFRPHVVYRAFQGDLGTARAAIS